MRNNELLEMLETRFSEIRQEFAAVRRENAAAHEETRHYLKVTIESLEAKVGLVSEGVIGVNEKLDRESASIRAEMRQGFADTQAMSGFSNNQLGRRVTALENAGDR